MNLVENPSPAPAFLPHYSSRPPALSTLSSVTAQSPYPFWINFIAGGTALAVSFGVTYPLDTYKTLVQASRLSTGPSLPKITPRLLCRGLLTSTWPAFPQGGLRLATYQALKDRQYPNVIAVILADLASSIVKVPRELITARLQTQPSSSAWSICHSILRTEGPKGLFKGFWTTSARDWPFMISLFATYEKFNHFHAQWGSQSWIAPIIYGGLSGALAAFVTMPFDVLRTAIMTQSIPSGPNRPQMSLKWMNLIQHISSQSPSSSSLGKIQPFFAGGASRSLWWFGVCSVFFPLYEYLQVTMSARP
jgi:solute carrier family 25 S-adenosylmethionine transporter 26